MLFAVMLLALTAACSMRRYTGPIVPVNGEFGGIDDVGRVLPLSGETPNARDRKVGIFYFVWQGEHGRQGPYDNYKIVLSDPDAIKSEENWIAAGGGDRYRHHFWGEPLFGYYVSTDEWVLRKHVQMLTDAGIDFIMFDTTNGPKYVDRIKQVIKIWYEYLEQGWNVPKLTFLTNNDSGGHIMTYYTELYTNEEMHELYPRLDELWYQWDGKPMITAAPGWIVEVPIEVENYFTIKDTIWPTEARTDNGFPWMEFSRLYTERAVYGRKGRKEVVSVSVAQHNATINFANAAWYGGGDQTRSFHDGAVDRSPGAIYWGYNFADQWKWAIGVDPEMVFVTGWNEWVAQRQPGNFDQPISFVDCADPEASRDIEPMNGLFGDNYYMQLISNVRMYKGTEGRVAIGGNVTIDLDGGFDQWDSDRITAVYTDYEGDTAFRCSPGFGGIPYIDETGRNDFVKFKVVRDRNYIYFYAETAEDITPSTDENWMTLFISSGAWRDSKNGALAGNLLGNGDASFWYDGIDFAVNLEAPEGNTVFVSKYSGPDKGWVRAGTGEMRVSGNKMMVRLSKKLLGIEQGLKLVDVRFKWADNYQWNEDGSLDIWTFYRNGDSAPLGRLTYVYSERR
ncbi:MAG: hypothetical protein J5950_02240 [Clostridia bacterium]|nr:hypothetical protein [Clostridia bacterium]